MPEFLTLHDADKIEQEAAPIPSPGLAHVFVGMIRRPTETLTDAFEHAHQPTALALAAVGGVYWAMNFAVAQTVGESVSLPMLVGGGLLLGLAGGVAYLYAISILLNWSSDILDGEPSRAKVRMSLAYVGVPGIIALVLFGLPRMAIFGRTLFLPERAWLDANPALVWGLWFGDALCFAWSLMLAVKAFKLMNRFTTARAVAALVLPLAPIALIGLLFVAVVWSGIFFAPPAF